MSSPPTFGRRGVQAAAASAAPYRPTPASAPRTDPLREPWTDPSPSASRPRFEPRASSGPSAFVARLFSFEGRFSRRQYWLTRVCVIFTMRVLTLCAHGTSAGLNAAKAQNAVTPGLLGATLLSLFLLLAVLFAGLWIGLAAAVKRWHDRDKAGTWALLGFVPIVGWLWQFVECGFMEGTPGPNRFGPDPKGPASAAYHDKLAETFA